MTELPCDLAPLPSESTLWTDNRAAARLFAPARLTVIFKFLID
jgi:hypothetical protein